MQLKMKLFSYGIVANMKMTGICLNMFLYYIHIANVCNSFHYLNPWTKSVVILIADSVKVLRLESK